MPNYPDRDLAHEADLRQLRRAQLIADCADDVGVRAHDEDWDTVPPEYGGYCYDAQLDDVDPR